VNKPFFFVKGLQNQILSVILKAIESKIYEGSVEGFENKYAIIGFDSKGNLLEILYNIMDSESINIFHAMRCRNSFIKQHEDMGRKNRWR